MAGMANSIVSHNSLVGRLGSHNEVEASLSSNNPIAAGVGTAYNPVYALVNEAGAQIVLFINSSDYKMYAQLKDKSGNLIYTSNIIDLPLETMVVSGRYDDGTKTLILTLDNGNEIEIPLGALISGLVNTDDLEEILNGYWSKEEITIEDIDNWNHKQEVLNPGDGIKIYAETELGGDIYQETTLGTNLVKSTLNYLKSNNTDGTWNDNKYTLYNVEFTVNTDLSITVTGEASANTYFFINRKGTGYESTTLDAGTYYYSCGVAGSNSTWKMQFNDGSSHNLYGTEITYTYTEGAEISFYILVYSGKNPNGVTFYPMIAISSGVDYEKPTNGASPNPDFPQNIEVATGNQSIDIIGKNLFKPFNYNRTNNGIDFAYSEDGYITCNGTSTGNALSLTSSSSASYQITLQAGIYTISGEKTDIRLEVVNTSGTALCNTDSSRTFTLSETTNVFVRANIVSGKTVNNVKVYPMLELGDTVTEYELYQSQNYKVDLDDIELCKIGDYQDFIKKGTGKNLYNGVSAHKGVNATTGAITDFTGTENVNKYLGMNNKVAVQSNTTYTIKFYDVSGNKNFNYTTYKQDETYIERFSSAVAVDGTATFTTGDNVGYVFCYLYNSNAELTNEGTNIQLETGSTASSYEPYGTDWYIKKEIGKVVLDGTEVWSIATNPNGTYRFYITRPSNSTNQNCLSNYFTYNSSYTANDNSIYIGNSNLIFSRVLQNSVYIETSNDFKTWLSTHNTIVYYVLTTPTYETITQQELINQLNDLSAGLANNWVENINQTSDNLPIILDYDNEDLTITTYLPDYVKFTDYASSTTGGVIKVNSNYATRIGSSGAMTSVHKSYGDYNSMDNTGFISKGTLENVIIGKELTNKTYVDGLVGDIETILETLDIGSGV